jgi:FtsX-like permease family
MRGVRAPFLLRRMASAWLLLGAFAITVFIAAALLAALASFNAQVLPQAARRQLSAASGQTGIVVSAPVDASIAAADQPAVRAALHDAFQSAPYHLSSAVWSNPLGLPRAAGSKVIPLAEAAAPGQIRQHAALVSGMWPGSPAPGQPVPAAVPAIAASQLGLKPGDVVAVHDRDTGRRSSIRVTGVFTLRDPASAYWGLDIVGTSGVSTAPGYTTYGPFVVSPAAFSARPGGLTVGQASWAAGLEPERIPASQLTGLGPRISHEASYLQNTVRLGGLQVTSGLPGLLAGLSRDLAVARSLLVISALQLLLLAAAALLLVIRLLTSHRSAENALLSSRGAASWQLAGITLTETLVLAAVAAAAGAVAGTRLAGLLGRAGALKADRIALAGFPPSAWLAVVLMLVLCLAIAVWPALRPGTPGETAQRRGGRAATVVGVARSGADVALVVLALIALRELRSYSAVARLPSGGLGLDPVLAAAPALALAAASLILLRLLPVVARLLERLVARGRRLGGALASWEISRRAVTQSGPVLLAVLAVATGTLTLAQYQSWRQSAHDQAAFAAGADVRVDPAASLSLAQAGAVSHARGVTAAMPVSRSPVSSIQSGLRGTLLAIDTSQAARTALLRPDLSPLPAARLYRLMASPAAAGLALPGRPDRVQVTASLAAGGQAELRRLAATIWVQGADGVVYALPAGAIAGDGRSHQLTAPIAASASYPLRLLGVSLTYLMGPPGGRESKTAPPASTLTISRLAAGDRVLGGRVLAGWQATVSAPGVDQLRPNVARVPSVSSWRTAGGGQQLVFQAGYAPGPGVKFSPAGYSATVFLAARDRSAVLAGVATRQFMTINHLHTGSVVTVPAAGTALPVRITAVITAFPTAPGSVLLVGQAAAQALLASHDAGPLPVTQWWLATSHGRVPPGLPSGSSVIVRSRLLAALLDNSLAAAPLLEGLAIAGAAALLAGLGFSAGVAASVRSRRAQSALLAALGYPRLAQAAGLCLEELMLTGPAALAGLGVGAGLAHLIIPAITLTPRATAPVPAVLVQTPLGWALLLALVVIVTPVAVAAVVLARRPDPAAELRAAEA